MTPQLTHTQELEEEASLSSLEMIIQGSRRRKVRSACDRCHQQKVRCLKKSTEPNSCERCTKLKAECRFSPREPRKKKQLWDTKPRPGTLSPALAIPIAPAGSHEPSSSYEEGEESGTMLTSGVVGFGYDDWSSSSSFMPNVMGIGNPRGPGLGNPGSYLNRRSEFSIIPDDDGDDDPAGGDVQAMCLSWPPNPFLNGPLPLTVDTHTPDAGAGAGADGGIGQQEVYSSSIFPNVLTLPPNEPSLSVVSERDHFSASPSIISSGRHYLQCYPIHYGLGGQLTSAERLTNLHTALYECASKLPSIKTSPARSHTEPAAAFPANAPCLAGGSNSNSNSNSNSTKKRSAALLAIDEVFRVTKEFIDITRSDIFPAANRHHIQPTFPYSPPSSSSSPSPLSPHPDDATLFTFLSCHSRLVEIYEVIFGAIHRCIRGPHHHYSSSSHSGGVILPQLQVGGSCSSGGGIGSPPLRVDFSGPRRLPPATIFMYMTIVITLSSELWMQVWEAMQAGKKNHNSMSSQILPSVPPELTDPIWNIAITKTDAMAQTIKTVQHALHRGDCHSSG